MLRARHGEARRIGRPSVSDHVWTGEAIVSLPDRP